MLRSKLPRTTRPLADPQRAVDILKYTIPQPPNSTHNTTNHLRAGAWKLINGWMDAVVASKVHFTKSIDDLDKFIARDQIPRELCGDEDWEYKYVEPEEDENETMEDTATRDSLMYERMMIGFRMLGATAAWISASTASKGRAENNNAGLEELKTRRKAIIEDFRQNYWKLDPFVRSRALVDRSGVLRSDGIVMAGAEAEADDEMRYEW